MSRPDIQRPAALQRPECGSGAQRPDRAPPLTSDLSVTLASIITCPQCGTATSETMPTDACQFFYDCPGCGAVLRPNPGDCCVFCSFGTVPCPPIQVQRGMCCG